MLKNLGHQQLMSNFSTKALVRPQTLKENTQSETQKITIALTTL